MFPLTETGFDELSDAVRQDEIANLIDAFLERCELELYDERD